MVNFRDRQLDMAPDYLRAQIKLTEKGNGKKRDESSRHTPCAVVALGGKLVKSFAKPTGITPVGFFLMLPVCPNPRHAA